MMLETDTSLTYSAPVGLQPRPKTLIRGKKTSGQRWNGRMKDATLAGRHV